MYPMKPYNHGIIDVKPAKIVYEMSSYHMNSLNKTPLDNFNNQTNKIEIKKNENIVKSFQRPENLKDQERIARRLFELSKQLDIFILKETQNTNNKVKESKQITTETDQAAKKNKKKTEIVNKSDSSFQNKSSNSSINPIIETKLSFDGGSEFLFKELYKNSPDLLHANVSPTVDRFPIHDYGAYETRKYFIGYKINCILREVDRPLVKLFDAIGQKRGIHFIEMEMNNKSIENKSEAILIEISYGQNAALKGNNLELFGELSIWKFIGSLLGLYSFEDLYVSLKSDKWLLEASLLDNNHNTLDMLSRRLSKYLGSKEFLSSSHAICLADIVLRSRFSKDFKIIEWDNILAANNVQIWAKLIDIAI